MMSHPKIPDAKSLARFWQRALAVFGTVPGAAEDRRRALREALAAGLIIVLASGTANLGLWHAAETTITEELREELVRIACAAATVVDVDLHATLRDPDAIDSPDYCRAVAPLKRMVAAVPEVRYIYTAVRDGDHARFILDASEPGDQDGDGIEDRAQLGEVYEDPEPAIFVALGDGTSPGRALCTGRSYTDKWGTFVTGYAPFYAADGQQQGVVGVDIDSRKYAKRLHVARMRALVGTIPAMLVTLLAIVGVYLNRLRMLTTARALTESEQRFRATTDAASALIWTSDVNGKYTWFNRTWIAFTGRTLEQDLGDGWIEVIHPDDRETCLAAFHQAIATRSTFFCSYRLRRHDGQYRTVEDWGSPNIDAIGECRGYVGIAIDISERLEAEQKLLRAAALLETTGQMARIGGWELDLQTEVLTWSEQVYRIYDLPPNAPVTFEESIRYFSPVAQQQLRAAMTAAIEEEKPWDLELPFINANGQRLWVRVQGCPDKVDGKVLRLRGALHDVTQRFDAQLALVEAMKRADAATRAKSEFIANMSHEIRTPLTAILGYAEMLEESEIMDSPQRRCQTIQTIRQASEHLLTIVNDILDISKIEAGKMTVECVALDLPALLASVESLMRPHAAKKNLQLTLKLAANLPRIVRTDPTRLRQVLLNLTGNAIKFTDQGGITLCVSAQQTAEGIRIAFAVEDTGMGLSEEEMHRLFSAFSQSDTSVTRKHGGTGLGLVLCKRFTRLLGGDVEITRSTPGVGSVFTATILTEEVTSANYMNPVDNLLRPVETHAQSLTQSLQGRILLAEDGADNQRLISHILRRAGADVEIAENGRVALDRLLKANAAAPFDLLITDIQMPDMDGYTLTTRVREQGMTIPIVALTAHVMAEDRQRCLAAGCNDFATKPIDKQSLLATCEKWLQTAPSSQVLSV